MLFVIIGYTQNFVISVQAQIWVCTCTELQPQEYRARLRILVGFSSGLGSRSPSRQAWNWGEDASQPFPFQLQSYFNLVALLSAFFCEQVFVFSLTSLVFSSLLFLHFLFKKNKQTVIFQCFTPMLSSLPYFTMGFGVFSPFSGFTSFPPLFLPPYLVGLTCSSGRQLLFNSKLAC